MENFWRFLKVFPPFYKFLCSLWSQNLGPGQTDATSLANNSQHWWMLQVASVCTSCFSKFEIACSKRSDSGERCGVEKAPHYLNAWNRLSLKPIKRLTACKWTQQLPTLLAQQCWELLSPFAHSFTSKVGSYERESTFFFFWFNIESNFCSSGFEWI